MTECYKTCKFRLISNYCTKFNERIPGGRILLHPLSYLEIFYRSSNDIEHLIDIAEKFSNEESSKNICKQYREKGNITEKQRKLLAFNILNKCYEERENDSIATNDFDSGLSSQIED